MTVSRRRFLGLALAVPLVSAMHRAPHQKAAKPPPTTTTTTSPSSSTGRDPFIVGRSMLRSTEGLKG